MLSSLVDLLFGCWHTNYSFPITAKPGERRSAAAQPTGTYVVCLECGKEFPYDWQQMKVVGYGYQPSQHAEPVVINSEQPALVSKQAA
jgi:hypothetical protein